MSHDHIKATNNGFRTGMLPVCHQMSVVIESSRFPSWVWVTPMNTEEWLESYNIT